MTLCISVRRSHDLAGRPRRCHHAAMFGSCGCWSGSDSTPIPRVRVRLYAASRIRPGSNRPRRAVCSRAGRSHSGRPQWRSSADRFPGSQCNREQGRRARASRARLCAQLRNERPILRQLYRPCWKHRRRALCEVGQSGGCRSRVAVRSALGWSRRAAFIAQPFANHNGGNLAFGPDGFLYVGLGDGGSANDPGNRAQNPTELLGKMLRIDVNVPDGHPSGYEVPSSNPFVGAGPPGTRPEIWSFGLRNPWRYSFDDPARGGSGALLIGDVGQGQFEEIDYEPPNRGGRNYGWRNREGAHDYIAMPAPAYSPLIDPIYEYGRNVGQSITGGYVYRGLGLGPSHRGRYFFADFVAGRVWSLSLIVDSTTGEADFTNVIEHTAELGGSLGNISSFGVDGAGELYFVGYSSGSIRKIVSASPRGATTGRLRRRRQGRHHRLSTFDRRWMTLLSGKSPQLLTHSMGNCPTTSRSLETTTATERSTLRSIARQLACGLSCCPPTTSRRTSFTSGALPDDVPVACRLSTAMARPTSPSIARRPVCGSCCFQRELSTYSPSVGMPERRARSCRLRR